MTTPSQNVAKLAFRFVLIIGIVNFFADMTYEGARSIVGPFLGSLGASAAIVGFVAGFGEMLGYGLRSVSGYFADKTHRYWAVTFVGYPVNMLAVPALALAGNWPTAAALMVAERTGRAIRRPAVESMLSHAGQSIGQGWVFGLNDALASLIFGKLLDKMGLPVLLVGFGISAFFAPLVFLHTAELEFVGMILWGMGMGAQDSCLKAVLSAIVPSQRRSTAFGVFDTGFGIAWFLGSAVMGLLYGKSIPAMVAFSVGLQLLALPVLALTRKQGMLTAT